MKLRFDSTIAQLNAHRLRQIHVCLTMWFIFLFFSYRLSNLWICWHWLLMRSARVQVWTVAVIDGTHIASGMKMGYKLSILMDLNCIRNFQAQTVADVRVSCYRWRTMHPVCNGMRSRSRLPPQGTVASPGIWSVDRFSWFRLLGSTLKKIENI